MPVSTKIVVECPKCGYTKVVKRGDVLPDASMFQKCPICGTTMRYSKKSVNEAYGILDIVFKLFRK